MTLSAESDLRKTIEALAVPGLQQSVAEIGRICELDTAGTQVNVAIELGVPAKSIHAELAAEIEQALTARPDIESVNVSVTTKITAHGVQPNLKPLTGVKNIIAVASGKGGVGKSTTAVNLALALMEEGASAGVLDADIYGPSIPLMMGVAGQNPTSDDGQSMIPLKAHGLQVMSIGFLIDPDEPMVWRGPMVTQALTQLLNQTDWSDLDYLIVDMPPGTGDIQLTLSQRVPVSGAVIVTTPQDVALLDAVKGLQMFRKVSVPVLGIIENMSTHVCTKCGHEEHLFGSGGGEKLASDHEIDLIGTLPLDIRIREQTDSGMPSVIAEPDAAPAIAYRSTARQMAARLATRKKDYSSRFPNIVIENS